nr:hypothetical protein [Pyrobaculum sp.]
MARGLWWIGVAFVILSVSLALWGVGHAGRVDVAAPREAINYAGNHTTLWGKIAALAHFDVVKTTEPLTCSDGVANFTCLLSKTDVRPILSALSKAGVKAEAREVGAEWVLVLYYNYTTAQWQWKNHTVIKAWELTWKNQTVKVYQTNIKKSLGEMLRLKERISEKFLIKGELKNITLVGAVLESLVVGTSNGTLGRVDESARERIRKKIREIDPEVNVEIAHIEPNTVQNRDSVFRPLVGGDKIATEWTTDTGPYTTNCTLGFVGRWADTPILTTAWHCIAWTYTAKTQGSVYIYQPLASSRYLISSDLAATCSYIWESENKLIVTCDIIPMRLSTSYEPKVFRPDTSTTFGQVVTKYCKYDVSTMRMLAKAGIKTDVTKGFIKSYNVDVTYRNQRWGSRTFDVVVKYLVSTSIYVEPGDSGSPVFTYEGSADRLGAYGIVSGRFMLFNIFFIESYVQNLCDLPFIFDPTR